MSRGPDKQPRLQPGEVRCGECHRPMLKAAAVIMNGETLHPIGCFEPAFKRYMKVVDERLQKHVGGFDLTVSMESTSPEIAYRLGRLSGDVLSALRARRASR